MLIASKSQRQHHGSCLYGGGGVKQNIKQIADGQKSEEELRKKLHEISDQLAEKKESRVKKSIEMEKRLRHDKSLSEEETEDLKKALATLDNQNVKDDRSKGEVLAAVLSGPVKRSLDVAIRKLFQVVRVGGSAGGTVISGGTFGDGVIELVLMLLPAAKLGVDVGILAATSSYAEDLTKIDFEGGPRIVELKLSKIMRRMRKDPRAKTVIRDLCMKFLSIIDSIAVTFGQIISAFIPNDFSISGIVVEEIIAAAAKDSYLLLRIFYDELPHFVTDILQSKENMIKFINQIIDLLVKNPDDSFWQQIGRGTLRSALITTATSAGAGASLVTGVVLLPLFPVFLVIAMGIGIGGASVQAGNIAYTAGVGDAQLMMLLDTQLRPRIPALVDVISSSLALGFISLKVLEEC